VPSAASPLLPIGAIASASGLAVSTIRYYERLGLLPRPARTVGGRRRYSTEVLEVLRFIDGLKILGLPLTDIRTLVRHRAGAQACRAMHDTIARHRTVVDARIDQLTAVRAVLDGFLRECAHTLAQAPAPRCPTWANLEHIDATPSAASGPALRQPGHARPPHIASRVPRRS
jgi:MerR family mercuric resistance operon transcriptional regulator